MKRLLLIVSILCILITMPLWGQQADFYVNIKTGNDANNGTSWITAFASLSKALEVTNAKGADYDGTIYIARGTYYPTSHKGITEIRNDEMDDYYIVPEVSSRENTFLITNNVKLYGGFSGDDPEETIASRDLTLNQTILSGNLVEGKVPDAELSATHVVLLLGTSSSLITPLLDGIHIIEGKAVPTFYKDWQMYMSFEYTWVNEQAIFCEYGGGIYSLNASFTLANANIRGNYAYMQGGGLYIENGSPSILNSTITGNAATGEGGGIFHENAQTNISGTTLAGNCCEGSKGGGITNSSGSQITISHSIIWGNRVNSGLNAVQANIYNLDGTTTLSHCIAEESDHINYYATKTKNIKGEGEVLAEDPDFIAYIDPIKNEFQPTSEGNYSLQPQSPAVFLNGMLFFLADAMPVVPGEDGIIYVKENSEGKGSNWDDAHPSLSEVLDFNNRQETPYTIYIAQGTYYPTTFAGKTVEDFTNDILLEQDYTFLIQNSMSIYGGFKGDDMEETPDDREEGENTTILSGNTDGTYHVVMISGPQGSTIAPLLDGLTITGGKANGEGLSSLNEINLPRSYGGGLVNNKANTLLHRVIITGNEAAANGGGIYNTKAPVSNLTTLSLQEVKITHNKAGFNGGGISNAGLIAGEQVTIAGNQADRTGGGLCDTGVSYLYYSFITGNASNMGGGISVNSSFMFYENGVKPTLRKIETRAGYENVWESNEAYSLLNNCILADNRATESGGGVYTIPLGSWASTAKVPVIENSIVWGNIAAGEPNSSNADLYACSNSVVQGNVMGENVITQDPLFVGAVDPTDTEWKPNTDGDYRIYAHSPALGIIGNQEVVDPFKSNRNNILYVNAAAEGDGTGESWEHAIPSLATAINYNNNQEEPYTLYVAKGTYSPENHNGLELNFGPLIQLTDRDHTFLITNDQQIYGGFKGDDMEETPDDRDLKNNATILDGQEEFYHVVVAFGEKETHIAPRLDGITITGGKANGLLPVDDAGGPRYDKIVQWQGGGILNLYADTELIRICLTGNEASTGGAIYNENSNPTLINVLIAGNTADYGGAIYNRDAQAILTNVTLAGNTVTQSGGAIYNEYLSPKRLLFYLPAASSDVTLRNCIIWGNQKEEETDNLFNGTGSKYTYSSSIIQGEHNTDPLLTADYHLAANSPAIGTGSVGLYTETGVSAFDADGADRLSSTSRKRTVIDPGAFEANGTPLPHPVPDIYTVVIPEVEGITTNPGPGLHYVEEFDHLVLYITVDENYSDIHVLINGEGVKPRETSPGTYIVIIPIKDKDITIEITGVKKNHSTGVSSAVSEEWQIETHSGNLCIRGGNQPLSVSIHTASGTLRYAKTISSIVNIPLAPGVYLITIGGKTQKQIVP